MSLFATPAFRQTSSPRMHEGRRVKRIFQTLDELAGCVDQEVAVSDWVSLAQEHVDLFAEATGDRQWIHVDVERAAAGPFGGTIAHGFLTLSLIPGLFGDSIGFVESRMGVNYGLNRVRFISPVRVPSRLRGRMKLLDAKRMSGDGIQFTWEITVELEGSAK